MAAKETYPPSFEVMKAFHPQMDAAGYGLAVFMSETEKDPAINKLEATWKRRRAQPAYKVKGCRVSLLSSVFNAGQLLDHPSEKIRTKARQALFEAATYAMALSRAEGTAALDDLIENLAAELRALMLIKAA